MSSALVGAISLQAERLGPPPAFDISAEQSLPALPAAVEVAAYRIAVEAMTNVVRHAAAQRCRVVLGVGEGSSPALRVEVTDDGRGLPAAPRPGIGLASMRERASEVGGSINIARAGHSGTTIVARLPLPRAGAA